MQPSILFLTLLGADALQWATRGNSSARLKISHIISPVPPIRAGEAVTAHQSLVFKTMTAAKKHAENERPSLSVSLHAAMIAGDIPIETPPGFSPTPIVDRSTKSEYGCSKALPFVVDVVRALQSAAPDSELYVMSNADINVVPEFYIKVLEMYEIGWEGLDVLKVLVPDVCSGKDLNEEFGLSLHYATSISQFHPGHDTFVWKSTSTAHMIRNVEARGSIFFGYTPVGAVLANAIRDSVSVSSYQTVKGDHLTYHVGGDREHRDSDETADMIICCIDGMQAVERDHPECTYNVLHQRLLVESADCDYERLNKPLDL